jgi:S-adenosylmethionine hydrolase
MFVTFLSDYGWRDEFVGVCHGVLAGLAPNARVIDVTHGIGRHDVRAGAIVLRNALPFMPAGVHLAVVDPEVGGARRAVALRCADEERLLVGPDNGLLALAAEQFGGAVEAVDIGRSPHRLEPVSATFHGRDLFAPVAAALARGEPLAGAGDPLSVDELVGLELPRAEVRDGVLHAHVLLCDRFGNVILDAAHADLATIGLRLGSAVSVTVAGRERRARFASTFADVGDGELLLYEDAQHQLALAVNRGSAAEELGLARDATLQVAPA